MASVTAQATALAASLLVGGTGATPYLGRAEKFDDSRGAIEGRFSPGSEPIDVDSDPAIIVAEREERAGRTDIASSPSVQLTRNDLPEGPETFIYSGRKVTYDPTAEKKAYEAYLASLIEKVDGSPVEPRPGKKANLDLDPDAERYQDALSEKVLRSLREELRARY